MLRRLVRKLFFRGAPNHYAEEDLSPSRGIYSGQQTDWLLRAFAAFEHDVRTPLAEIAIQTALMKEQLASHQKHVERLERIDSASTRIASAVRFYAHFGREALGDSVRPRRVSMRNVITGSVERLREGRSVPRIVINFDGKHLFVNSYGSLLEEVIFAILKNATEAICEAKSAQGIIKIEVGSESTSRRVRISVIDNGCGIPKDDISKLMRAGFTTKLDNQPNAGMGLYIARKVVKMYDGELRITSEVGVGTTVSLWLPVADLPSA